MTALACACMGTAVSLPATATAAPNDWQQLIAVAGTSSSAARSRTSAAMASRSAGAGPVAWKKAQKVRSTPIGWIQPMPLRAMRSPTALSEGAGPSAAAHSAFSLPFQPIPGWPITSPASHRSVHRSSPELHVDLTGPTRCRIQIALGPAGRQRKGLWQRWPRLPKADPAKRSG
jgi:hypothetical protein